MKTSILFLCTDVRSEKPKIISSYYIGENGEFIGASTEYKDHSTIGEINRSSAGTRPYRKMKGVDQKVHFLVSSFTYAKQSRIRFNSPISL